MDNVTQFGESWEFGGPAGADVPTIGNFFARSAELRWESEVFAQAQDGEGLTDSIVISNADVRKITATFTGYITSGFDGDSIPLTFPFKSRTFFVRNVSFPRRKGEFVEVSLEAESYGRIA